MVFYFLDILKKILRNIQEILATKIVLILIKYQNKCLKQE